MSVRGGERLYIIRCSAIIDCVANVACVMKTKSLASILSHRVVFLDEFIDKLSEPVYDLPVVLALA